MKIFGNAYHYAEVKVNDYWFMKKPRPWYWKYKFIKYKKYPGCYEEPWTEYVLYVLFWKFFYMKMGA